jgi:hypothetical protein
MLQYIDNINFGLLVRCSNTTTCFAISFRTTLGIASELSGGKQSSINGVHVINMMFTTGTYRGS